MEAVVALLVVVVVGGCVLWAQYGALFQRRYPRVSADDTVDPARGSEDDDGM
jgi:hypothetical protein